MESGRRDLGAVRNVILVAGLILSNRVATCGGKASAEVLERRVASAVVVNEEIYR